MVLMVLGIVHYTVVGISNLRSEQEHTQKYSQLELDEDIFT